MTTSEWASWVQAVGSILAIGIAIYVTRMQAQSAANLVRDSENRKREHDEALTLLSLQSMASELRRMCMMVGFQISDVGNFIIYPDISAEFQSISKMLSELPIDHISAQAKISDLLHLQRIANAMNILFKAAPMQGDGFYFDHRTQITKLEKEAGGCAASLAKSLEAFAPELYAQHKESLHRL